MIYTNGKRYLWVHAWDENTDNSVYTYTSDEESYALEEKDEITLFNLLKPELHKTCKVQKADRKSAFIFHFIQLSHEFRN